jgi:hypothetical protein
MLTEKDETYVPFTCSTYVPFTSLRMKDLPQQAQQLSEEIQE